MCQRAEKTFLHRTVPRITERALCSPNIPCQKRNLPHVYINAPHVPKNQLLSLHEAIQEGDKFRDLQCTVLCFQKVLIFVADIT